MQSEKRYRIFASANIAWNSLPSGTHRPISPYLLIPFAMGVREKSGGGAQMGVAGRQRSTTEPSAAPVVPVAPIKQSFQARMILPAGIRSWQRSGTSRKTSRWLPTMCCPVVRFLSGGSAPRDMNGRRRSVPAYREAAARSVPTINLLQASTT